MNKLNILVESQITNHDEIVTRWNKILINNNGNIHYISLSRILYHIRISMYLDQSWRIAHEYRWSTQIFQSTQNKGRWMMRCKLRTCGDDGRWRFTQLMKNFNVENIIHNKNIIYKNFNIKRKWYESKDYRTNQYTKSTIQHIQFIFAEIKITWWINDEEDRRHNPWNRPIFFLNEVIKILWYRLIINKKIKVPL